MKNSRKITEAGIIAALYIVLTWLSSVLGLSSGAIQCRFSEALCILPVFTGAAIPGLTIGCIISNVITTGNIIDIVIGSAATLIGAIGARALKNCPLRAVATLPTVVANALLVPFAIRIMSGSDALYLYYVATVAIGEIISCTVLGTLLSGVLEKCGTRKYFDK